MDVGTNVSVYKWGGTSILPNLAEPRQPAPGAGRADHHDNNDNNDNNDNDNNTNDSSSTNTIRIQESAEPKTGGYTIPETMFMCSNIQYLDLV